jgi:hypothetical protein
MALDWLPGCQLSLGAPLQMPSYSGALSRVTRGVVAVLFCILAITYLLERCPMWPTYGSMGGLPAGGEAVAGT